MKIVGWALAGLLALGSLAMAKDCAPVETAPGVRTKPAGCADLGREAPPRKPGNDRLSGQDGWMVLRDGTRVRIFGSTGYEAGTRSR